MQRRDAVIKQFGSQAETCAMARLIIQKAIEHGINQNGTMKIGAAGVLELAQALEIIVRCERQAVLDIEVRNGDSTATDI